MEFHGAQASRSFEGPISEWLGCPHGLLGHTELLGLRQELLTQLAGSASNGAEEQEGVAEGVGRRVPSLRSEL